MLWSELSPSSSPSARYGAVSAYLPSTGLVYLFGGQSSSSSFLSDTWDWNGTTWSQLSPSSSPSARAAAALAYAGTLGSTANDLVLYGGVGSGGVVGDTWSFNGTTWAEQSTSEGPGPLENSALSYDSTLSVPVLYGGDDAGSVSNGLWAWNGTEWVEGAGNSVVDLTGMGMAPDASDG